MGVLPDQAGEAEGADPVAAWFRVHYALLEAAGTLACDLPGAGPEAGIPAAQLPPPPPAGSAKSGATAPQKRGGEGPARASAAGGGNAGGPSDAANPRQRPHAKVWF
jgi:hypothetical protein